ncbi:PAS domain-containing sensor histidine kinase [Sedimentibacter sp. B4]|uniref:sensor histidine kinase n=1 Tax=Sedimentibacter sp. B4 TaxID=304766 RepID=UPI00031176F1|nr:PAS domain-containing sensor histidine kinase [Sedimentibacter sp. B4]
MAYILKRKTIKPILYIKNNTTTGVNNEFEKLTGYQNVELLEKSIVEMNNLLHVNSKNHLENIEGEHNCYIFTKKCEAREVSITCKRNKTENEQIFFFKEKKNSRIEDRIAYAMKILLENEIGVAIYSIPDLHILKVNQKYLDNVPIINKIEDIYCKSIYDIFLGVKGSHLENIISNVIKTSEKYDAKEVKYNCPIKGDTYWDSSFVSINIKGEAKYLIHKVINVTENVVLRKIMEEQKLEMEAIIENMSDELIIFNKSGKVTKINKSARANPIIDLKNTRNFNEFQNQVNDINGNAISIDNMLFANIISGEKVNDYTIVKNDINGLHYKELNGAPIYDSEGNFIAGVLISRDITEKINNERNHYIKAQYDSLSYIIENLDLGFARYTYPEFNLIDINNKGYDQLKKIFPNLHSKACIKSQNLFVVFNEKVQIIDDMVRDSLSTNKKSCFKTCKYNIEKETVFIKWIYQPLFDLNNEITEIIVIGIDITNEVKEKQKMEQALKIQDEVYANVSHELKTPLNVIFSANQMLDMYLKKDSIEVEKEKLQHYNDNIKQNCYRLIKLINNVVDMSKSNSGLLKLDLSNEDIVNIIENIVQSVSEYVKSRGLSIIFDTEIEEKIIACDPEKIERVILNLISNAIKFSNTSGVIYVNILDKGEVVEISVKDTGEGIEKKHLDLIFQRFYQANKSLSRNAEGTGIGLSLIKSIVELHGGNISVESEVNKGSTFKVELPARIIENQKHRKQSKYMNDKVEKLNIEFSDIYSIF